MSNLLTATLGGGCFWCTEACFQRLKGVNSILPGFAGGHLKNPTYKQVCSGTTGHAEVVEIKFDPNILTFNNILQIFFRIHDPTTLNRQGNDVGEHYRSIILCHDQEQKLIAEQVKQQIEDAKVYKDKIVTQIVDFDQFYKAEDYHENYYNLNKDSNSYCQFVVKSKVDKFLHLFKDQAKE